MGILCFGCYVAHMGLTLIPAGFNKPFLAAGSLLIIVGAVSTTTILLGIGGVIILNRRLLGVVSSLVALINGS